ncbi:MAG: polysaccharide deacetylase family protein [Actinomycetota bacterium]
MVLLGLILAVEMAWRGGLIGHHEEAIALTPVAAGEAAGPDRPLSGPPVTTPTHATSTLDRLIAVGEPVMCGGGNKPLVALTFDDGPGPYTHRTVGMLREAGARATFFIVAKEILDWPALGDEPAEEATVAAIGDHTYDHIDLLGISQDELDHQIVDSRQLIEEHADTRVRLFRPPYGHHDDAVDREVQAAGMLQVLWSVDSQDGIAGATATQVLENVRDGLRPGAIVLMHENRGTTLQELPAILGAVRAAGLHTVTVPELLAADPPSTEQLRSGSC